MAGHYETAAGSNPDMAFEHFDLFRTDDLSVVNLECPITDRGTRADKPYNFRMRPDYVPALSRAGIDLVNIANNHIFDYGNAGLFDTISYLDSAGVHHIGAGKRPEDARKPLIFDIRGIKVGLAGYYAGGEAPAVSDTAPGVNQRRLESVQADIRTLRDRDSVDYIVVSFHWGNEKADRPDSDQVWFAHQAIRAGADAVVGHHTHVLSGIERYRGGVIVYSLGNFLFGGKYVPSYDTAVFEIKLRDRKPEYRVIPVRVRNWRLVELDGPAARAVVDSVKVRSLEFEESIFSE